MLDFTYSVPPSHLAHEAGVAWGLAQGFARSDAMAARHAKHRMANAHAARPEPLAEPMGWSPAPAAPWLLARPSASDAISGVSDVAQTFARILDEVDYGIVLLTADACLLYANHAARHELASRRGLRQVGYVVAPSREAQRQLFAQALEGAAAGKRDMLALGPAETPLMVAVTPVDSPILNDAAPAGSAPTEQRIMLTFGKSAVCEPLSFRMFAKLYNLSATESEVLRAAIDGHTAAEIAKLQHVAISTVRTHLNSIRTKTGARSLRALIARMGALPPIVPTARW